MGGKWYNYIVKRSPLKRKSKSDIRKLQDKLWELCKQIIRLRYPHFCYTCDKPIEGSNCQTGHFIPKASSPAELKYSLDNLRLQCYHCNINLGGNGTEFYRRLEHNEGKEYVDKLFKAKYILVKADTMWYENKIQEYTAILDRLQKELDN